MPKRSLQQQNSSNQLRPLTLKIRIPKHACSCLPDIDVFKLVTFIKITPQKTIPFPNSSLPYRKILSTKGMRMCSILGAQEGEDSFKRLGKICLVKNIYSKGERGFRYRGKMDIQSIRMCYLLYI